jgi:hypothetical protein
MERKLGLPLDPFGEAKNRFCDWLKAEKENAGVVVFVATLTLKSGEKLPEVTCVTVPEPPAGMQFPPPEVRHASKCVELLR